MWKILSALAVAVGVSGGPALAALKGDAKAVAAAEKMIDRLGGGDVWASARTLRLVYHGWQSASGQPVIETAIRDLAEPYQLITYEGRRTHTTFSMTPAASWLKQLKGERRFTEEEHALNIAFFDYDFYTIIRSLARGDERLALSDLGDRKIGIRGPDDADWGWFEIDATGQPVRWGANYGDEKLEYIYGPVKSFGNIEFPAWGAASDGSWRFDYVDVDVDRAPPNLKLVAPKK